MLRIHKVLLSTAVALVNCMGAAQFTLAQSSASQADGILISQSYLEHTTNSEGVPILQNSAVRGQITSIDGDSVQLALSGGESRTYRIPEFDQRLHALEIGKNVTLTVRRNDNAVIAISDVTANAR